MTRIQKGSITYGEQTIGYNLNIVDRKTMEIAVHPDLTVNVKAPLQTKIEVINRKIKKRARWILNQIAYFQQYLPRTTQRRFVNGESHRYLGRQYRLKCVQSDKKQVKLINGTFQVECNKKPTAQDVEALLQDWYLQRAKRQFNERFNQCWSKFRSKGLNKPQINIKRMKTRWGSLTKSGTINLNVELVKAPKECIDYVVTHELCHLKYYDHSSQFYALLEGVFPRWKKVKHKLELCMS